MAKSSKKKSAKKANKTKAALTPTTLKGWEQIASFLAQPMNVAQRWARADAMPITRQGRYVTATRDDLNKWLGREASGEPLHVATPDADLAGELKRGLAFLRQQKRSRG